MRLGEVSGPVAVTNRCLPEGKVVPQEWIEHSTSPLPRARSTTELLRHGVALSGAESATRAVCGATVPPCALWQAPMRAPVVQNAP